MIINDLDVLSASVRPTEADAELVVYPDAMLSRPVTSEGFQAITRWHAEIIQSTCDLQLPQLAARDGCDIREPFDRLPLRNSLRVGALERSDHQSIVTQYVINVKRDYRPVVWAELWPEPGSLRSRHTGCDLPVRLPLSVKRFCTNCSLKREAPMPSWRRRRLRAADCLIWSAPCAPLIGSV